MALSEREQQVLRDLESQLHEDDPELAQTFQREERRLSRPSPRHIGGGVALGLVGPPRIGTEGRSGPPSWTASPSAGIADATPRTDQLVPSSPPSPTFSPSPLRPHSCAPQAVSAHADLHLTPLPPHPSTRASPPPLRLNRSCLQRSPVRDGT